MTCSLPASRVSVPTPSPLPHQLHWPASSSSNLITEVPWGSPFCPLIFTRWAASCHSVPGTHVTRSERPFPTSALSTAAASLRLPPGIPAAFCAWSLCHDLPLAHTSLTRHASSGIRPSRGSGVQPFDSQSVLTELLYQELRGPSETLMRKDSTQVHLK